jgi:ATP-dependent Clp protease ATP-binding subunit ClpA
VRLETPCLVATLPMAVPDPIRPEYGARELKRTILRQLTQPLAAMVASGAIESGSVVHAEPASDGERLALVVQPD